VLLCYLNTYKLDKHVRYSKPEFEIKQLFCIGVFVNHLKVAFKLHMFLSINVIALLS